MTNRLFQKYVLFPFPMHTTAMVVPHLLFAHICLEQFGQCGVQYTDLQQNYTSQETTVIVHTHEPLMHGHTGDEQTHPNSGWLL